MEGITFANPEFFYLLLILIPIIIWYVFRHQKIAASIQVSNIDAFEKAPKTIRHYLRHLLFVLRVLAIAAVITVIARPQSTDNWENTTTEGIDIVIAMDISSSMLAQDFRPNRLEASKEVATEFISGRRDDRMGLIVFSGETFTQCPLTTDLAVVINLLRELKSGLIADGTAIGMGLANAVSRLKDSKAISKVIILLTDGVNNQGEITPLDAANMAKMYGIRTYTIGVGTIGMAPYPFQTPFGIQYQNVKVEIDEGILREIAKLTNGKYFRATNKKNLIEIYKEIDKLEKSKIEVKEFSKKNEEYFIFALIACFCIGLEILLRNTILRNTP